MISCRKTGHFCTTVHRQYNSILNRRVFKSSYYTKAAIGLSIYIHLVFK